MKVLEAQEEGIAYRKGSQEILLDLKDIRYIFVTIVNNGHLKVLSYVILKHY